ncbi:hypothetical protein FB565_003338 [Actinoplanes lutulentus]|uniref:Surface cell wall-binding protein n=1 Tax=Actinoplanes lutulentus TaxID=1287878 RepID=A0A327Z1D9_9ACTN|nr:hypothetical protein [Actinoplanes lutulentus]MBB2943609.1 hypothetical protein [Actinoplanes lutulentus]RAK27474.1 hypothetical protein B0I29_123108 [Actinoplanes lutulentus]
MKARIPVALVCALAGATAFPAAALADPDEAQVEVTVDITEIREPGVLALTVAGGAATLQENGSDLLIRRFTGTLPTVTVTDTRTLDEIPDGSAWAVLGSSSDFTAAGKAPIDASHLGWKPKLIDGGDTGLVSEGEEVVPVLDEPTQPGNNVGLVDQELLVSTYDAETVTGGSYTVNAGLNLHTPADVAAGSYKATLTLSLFE